jgi:hypothetical protein
MWIKMKTGMHNLGGTPTMNLRRQKWMPGTSDARHSWETNHKSEETERWRRCIAGTRIGCSRRWQMIQSSTCKRIHKEDNQSANRYSDSRLSLEFESEAKKAGKHTLIAERCEGQWWRREEWVWRRWKTKAAERGTLDHRSSCLVNQNYQEKTRQTNENKVLTWNICLHE